MDASRDPWPDTIPNVIDGTPISIEVVSEFVVALDNLTKYLYRKGSLGKQSHRVCWNQFYDIVEEYGLANVLNWLENPARFEDHISEVIRDGQNFRVHIDYMASQIGSESINPQENYFLGSYHHFSVTSTQSVTPWRMTDNDILPTRAQASSIAAVNCQSVSGISESTYYTAFSRFGERSQVVRLGQLQEEDEYAQLLQSQKLWPVDPMSEQDWSGRGQHAKFEKDEQKLINEILEVKENLGSTRTAIVQSVKCRRILLARKTITCGKQTMTKEEAIKEVSHLTRLNHSHIVRVIGTYIKGRELSILLYPVTEYNLEGFLEVMKNPDTDQDLQLDMRTSCTLFYSCLSDAVRYIHESLTKHMDIKPRNILIKEKSFMDSFGAFRPFIADFGIARSYATPDDADTDGRTSFTKRYAAPEVINQDFRGLSADIYSLGCVFLEMFTSQYYLCREEKHPEPAIPEGKSSFETNTSKLEYMSRLIIAEELSKRHIGNLVKAGFLPGPPSHRLDEPPLLFMIITLELFMKMVSKDPKSRPTAKEVCAGLQEHKCCSFGQVQLEAFPFE